MGDLQLPDIQGFIMRTYAMDALRVFVLRVAQAPHAARFLASLVGGSPDARRAGHGDAVGAEARVLRQHRLHP